MKKFKLTIEEQIEHMKSDLGISFEIVNEQSAKIFLSHHNYYFRIKAFAKNFEKYKSGLDKGKYVNLEFAYLQELSIIDMYFRKLILDITLDIEHALKTRLLFDFSNSRQDGYLIIEKFLKNNKKVESDLTRKKRFNSAVRDLIEKYDGQFALWNIVEVLNFADFLQLFDLFYKMESNPIELSKALWSVRILRNAAAHNNCLLNTLRIPYKYKHHDFNPNRTVVRLVSNNPRIERTLRVNKLKNPVIYDLTATLIIFNYFVESDAIKQKTYKELDNLINVRCLRNKHYFCQNNSIVSAYRYMKFLIDDLAKDYL
jgi:abortive infection bacteriophage resistance protein